MKQYRRLIALMLVLLLALCALAGAAGEEEAEEEIELDLETERDTLLATDVFYHTPNEWSAVKCSHDVCFWNLEMGRMDEEAIWTVMIQPVTVISGKQREQVLVLAEPDEKCEDYVGVVTCASQAVHVLEERGDWTLIEAYSSAEENSAADVFADQFQGWVKTKRLKEVEVDQTYGLLIDKLLQRLYVFKEGKLFSTLLCSTGFVKDRSVRFRETPAGEFLIVSWVGDFWAENLYCQKGMRVNSGILIHEVPRKTKERNGEIIEEYDTCERYLGEKASHGCIRVQRKATPEGVNIKWLWKNLSRKPYTKVIIWDDLNRELGYPDDDLTLYYNPAGGRSYHSQPTCQDCLSKYEPMTPFRYGDLDEEPFSKLEACSYCAPMPRKERIDEMNKKVRQKFD